MKILAYLQAELGVKVYELMEFKKQLPPEEWTALKDDARRDAKANGVDLED